MFGINRFPGILLLALLCSVTVSPAVTDAKPTEFPDPALAWTGVETTQAAKLLSSGKAQLPLMSDQNGKKVLERIVSRENLLVYADPQFSLPSRLGDYIQMVQSTNVILKLYLEANPLHPGKTHQEIAALEIYIIYVAATGMTLVQEFLPTIQKDEKYETRMQGLQKMYGGMFTTFSGLLMSTSEPRNFTGQEISAMLVALDETLPILKPAFSAESLGQLKIDLGKKLKSFTKTKDIDLVKHMIALLAA